MTATIIKSELAIGAAVVLAVLYALYRVSDAAKGAITGDNALTRSATDAAGKPVTAYQGAGVLGTLGAGVNAASGGWLASAGQWLGSAAYDWTHSATSPPAAPPARS